ncbi:hypothetical protein [Sinomicrobium weinanense]|uniref:Uncharacterized protein n=1 Tax=Sinomicrobium weinanense TaxID=2842200 RepID=A0A926Q2N8_9FLAO|nr:hypothetical protein [Sinomicrobium weinanense]MBC9795131.1 hypothetical protein [Sinomicrobium weinanense]MBU3123737.1 hypothetical protein [Sinomicrobium weinanense]
MKYTTTLIVVTLFFAVSVVLALHIAAPKKENHKHAGFDRVFAANDILRPLDTLDLRYHSYYIAGVDNSHLYLGNSQVPSHIVEAKLNNLKDTIHHNISVGNLKYRSIQVKVVAPYFYLTDGVIPFIYRGNITDWTAAPYKNNAYFMNAVPMDNGMLALIGLDNDMGKVFFKVTKGNPKLEVFPGLLEAQGGEVIFSTEGKLHYDKKTKQLTYVYLYRNQFLLMDDGFNLLYKGNTIDTISRVKIKVGEISSESTFTMAKPPISVNKRSTVSGNYLYVNSNILAGNEDPDTFENASIIDVYHLEKGEYEFSFYIPTYKEETLKEFMVIDNDTVIVKYRQYIVTYTLNTTYSNRSLTI